MRNHKYIKKEKKIHIKEGISSNRREELPPPPLPRTVHATFTAYGSRNSQSIGPAAERTFLPALPCLKGGATPPAPHVRSPPASRKNFAAAKSWSGGQEDHCGSDRYFFRSLSIHNAYIHQNKNSQLNFWGLHDIDPFCRR
jgi:hypothetical protein